MLLLRLLLLLILPPLCSCCQVARQVQPALPGLESTLVHSGYQVSVGHPLVRQQRCGLRIAHYALQQQQASGGVVGPQGVALPALVAGGRQLGCMGCSGDSP